MLSSYSNKQPKRQDRNVAIWHEGDSAYYLKWVHGGGRKYRLFRYEATIKKAHFTRLTIEWRDKRGVVFTTKVRPNQLERR